MRRTLFLVGPVLLAIVLTAACSSTPAVVNSADAAIDAASLDAANLDAGNLDAGSDGGKPYPLNQVCAPVNLRGDAGDGGDLDLACDECSQSNCCDTLKAAKASPNIQLFSACSGAPSCDAACLDACIRKYPVAAQAALTQRACRSHRCIGTCIPVHNACQRCVEDKCLPESLAYDMDLNAYVIDVCVSGCANAACISACVEQFPAGRPTYTTYTTCTLTRCAAECQ